MILYNYKAFSLNTSLTGDAIIEASKLEDVIKSLKPKTTLYTCYYNLEKRDSFKEYSGLLDFTFDTIHIDMDSKDDAGALAWEQAKALCKRLIVEGCGFQLYFSGNKGFHVAIHKSALGFTTPEPHDILSQKVKALLYGLKAEYSTVDTGIFDSSRKFRAYGSYHEKSNLYKIRLTGTGLSKLSDLTLDDIRIIATKPPTHSYMHPTPTIKPIPFLQACLQTEAQQKTNFKKAEQKEIPQGQFLDDDSMKFKNFKKKLCIKEMLEGANRQQNRHDVGLRIIYDMYDIGKTQTETEKIISEWATHHYEDDKGRIADTIRMVNDAYSKSEYRFGCYDEIRKIYCSAKCTLYKSLNHKLRAEPVDVSKNQGSENEVRRNPNLELSEGELADRILAEFGKPLIKCEGDFFTWEGTHWERGDRERANAMFYQLASMAYQNQAPFNRIESLVKQMKLKIPVSPETNYFFSSCTDKFNFLDGTLHVTKNETGKMVLTLLPHEMKDYLGYCNKYPYSGINNLPKTGHVQKYFESRLLDLGPDGVRMMKQMLGAAMIPYKPWIFMLIGDTNSGKSTMALMIKALLGEKNVSGVEPIKNNNNFQWEPSIGKIANIAIELPKGVPLDVNTLKKIRDKTTVDINRKGIKGVQATLPFLHIYCANSIPPSHEGNTGALDNRMTIINFKKVYVNGMADIDNLGQWLWDQDSGSVLEAAREGLADLISSNFKYFRSEKALNDMTDYQESTDPVKQFVQAVECGEFMISVKTYAHKDLGASFLGSEIFEKYKIWAENNNYFKGSSGWFYKEIERCGVEKVKRLEKGKHIFWAKAEKVVLPPAEERYNM